MELHKKLFSLKYLLLAILLIVVFIFSVCSSNCYDEQLIKLERNLQNSNNEIEELLSNVDSAQINSPSNLALYDLLKLEFLPVASGCSILNQLEISQAKEVFERNEDYERLSRLLLRVGQINSENNEFSEALASFFTALQYIENFNIKSLEAPCYFHIAMILKKLNFYADSWSYANKCMLSLQEGKESIKYKIESKLLIAEFETWAGNYQEAIKLLNSLKSDRTIDNEDYKDKISVLSIVPYFKMGYSKQAFEIFQGLKSKDSNLVYSELSPLVVTSLLRDNEKLAESNDYISDSINVFVENSILKEEFPRAENVKLSPLQFFKASQENFFEHYKAPFCKNNSTRNAILFIMFIIILISLIILISIRYRYVKHGKELSDDITKQQADLKINTQVVLNSIIHSRLLFNKLCDEYYEKKDFENLNASLQKVLEKEITEMRTSRFQESLIQEVNILNSNVLIRLKENIPNIKQREILFSALLVSGLTARSISLVMDINVGNFYNIWTRLKQKIEKSTYNQRQMLVMTIFRTK